MALFRSMDLAVVTVDSALAENLTSQECQARMANGAAYQVSIRPCRTEDNRIDGAILTAWPAVDNGE